MSHPTYASPVAPATRGPVLASIPRRVAAYAIDTAITIVLVTIFLIVSSVILVPLGGGSPEGTILMALVVYLVVGVVSLAWTLVYTGMQGGAGGSFGQRIVKVRVRDAVTGAPIGFGRALLRNIIWGLAGSIIVGYFTPLFDAVRHQGWHDKVGRDVVLDVTDAAPRAATPPPAPRASAPVAPPASAPPAPGAPRVPVPPPLPVGDFSPPTAPAYPSGAPASVAPAFRGPSGDGMISAVPGITIDPAGAAPAPRAVPTEAAPPAPERLTPTPPPATVAAPVVPPAPPQPVYAAPAVAGPVSGEIDIDETRAAAPARALVVLQWDDGTRTAVYTRTLFGRNPGREEGAVVAAIRDETLSLSKTHFEVGPAADGAYVIDRHSTNGTTLVRDGGRQILTAGIQTALRPGDQLEFGDRRATVGDGA